MFFVWAVLIWIPGNSRAARHYSNLDYLNTPTVEARNADMDDVNDIPTHRRSVPEILLTDNKYIDDIKQMRGNTKDAQHPLTGQRQGSIAHAFIKDLLNMMIKREIIHILMRNYACKLKIG